MAANAFRKKPVVIEAVQWTGDNVQEMFNHCAPLGQGEDWQIAPIAKGKPILIKTMEGEMAADIGDWIIRGVKGELYPCKPDIFSVTYDPADASPETNLVGSEPYGYTVELRAPDRKGGDFFITRSRVQKHLGVAKACVEHWKTIYDPEKWRFNIVPLYETPPQTKTRGLPSAEEIDAMIDRLLDAQQDINLSANETMSQPLCDASALIDDVEKMLNRVRALTTEGQPDGR